MRPQQLYELRKRFLQLDNKPVKVPASAFMAEVPPDRSTVFEPFKPHIRRLVKRGYSNAQIADYLSQNGIEISGRELIDLIGALQ